MFLTEKDFGLNTERSASFSGDGSGSGEVTAEGFMAAMGLVPGQTSSRSIPSGGTEFDREAWLAVNKDSIVKMTPWGTIKPKPTAAPAPGYKWEVKDKLSLLTEKWVQVPLPTPKPGYKWEEQNRMIPGREKWVQVWSPPPKPTGCMPGHMWLYTAEKGWYMVPQIQHGYMSTPQVPLSPKPTTVPPPGMDWVLKFPGTRSEKWVAEIAPESWTSPQASMPQTAAPQTAAPQTAAPQTATAKDGVPAWVLTAGSALAYFMFK